MTMFPPVEDSVLQNNPDFTNLYNKLTNVVLNPDGSTKNDPRAKERAAVREVRDYLHDSWLNYMRQNRSDSIYRNSTAGVLFVPNNIS
jgi:hypothetical protein